MKNSISIYTFLLLVFCAFSAYAQQLNTESKAFQQEFLQRINAIRASGCNCGGQEMPPVQPVSWNTQLEAAAQMHADDMYIENYFSHESISGAKLKQRLERTGYNLSNVRRYAIGENIAKGQRSIPQVITSWINSPTHCKNLMNPDFREMGVAFRKYYWVQDFGMRLGGNSGSRFISF